MNFFSADERADFMRLLMNSAVDRGREKYSEQTGFLHYNYQDREADHAQTIPLYDNALFALALMRTHLMEQVQEGHSLLDKILHFQNKGESMSSGNFPFYLHEYPECKSYWSSARLIPVFYWMLQEFGKILGSERRSALKEATFSLLNYCQQRAAEENVPFPHNYYIAAGLTAIGRMLEKKEMQREGEQWLNRLENDSEQWLYSPRYLGDLMVVWQMVHPDLSAPPWKNLLHHVSQVWHGPSSSYIGPPINEYQWGKEQEITLFDLYLYTLSGKVAEKCPRGHYAFLQAALIRPLLTEFSLEEENSSQEGHLSDGESQNRQWVTVKEESYAYSVLQDSTLFPPSDGYHLFRALWQGNPSFHSLVCTKGKYDFDFDKKEKGVDLFFDLKEPEDLDNKSNCREIIFYGNLSKNLVLSVNGTRANTFQIGDEVTCSEGEDSFTMRFTQETGDGKFYGHFMRGNRPSQLRRKKVKAFHAYDFMLMLRTVRRSMPCRIKVEIRFS